MVFMQSCRTSHQHSVSNDYFAIPEIPMNPVERHVFVYGTLRRGGANDITQLSPAAHFVGLGSVQGTLYDLGAYPGLVLSRAMENALQNAVVGEVYAISDALETQLDEIEGLAPTPNGEYVKQKVPVDIAGNQMLCLVYEIDPSWVNNRPVIASGNWLRHVGAAGPGGSAD